MTISFRRVIPENYKSSYGENDTVDFILSFPDSVLNMGSIRLEGVLDVLVADQGARFGIGQSTNGNELKDEVLMDPFVGAHSLFSSIQTEMNGSVIENVNNLPRFVKMVSAAQNMPADMCNSRNICELKAPSKVMASTILCGEVPSDGNQPTENVNYGPDFSIRPLIALNSAKGQLPYARSGDIRISLNLARTVEVLYGMNVTADFQANIQDLRLTYSTYPDPGGNMSPIQLRSITSIKQSIQSSLSNNASKVPAVVSAVSVSFNLQTNENTIQGNHLALQTVPELDELQLNFNDSTNKGISFVIRDNVETIGRYIDSFGDTGRNSMSRKAMANNRAYGVGLDFGGDEIDLRRQKFNTQINSGITNNTAMVMHMYFHSLITV